MTCVIPPGSGTVDGDPLGTIEESNEENLSKTDQDEDITVNSPSIPSEDSLASQPIDIKLTSDLIEANSTQEPIDPPAESTDISTAADPTEVHSASDAFSESVDETINVSPKDTQITGKPQQHAMITY